MWDFDPILTESRNWSNEELHGRAVQAEKNSHKDNILSEKAAKKSHEARNCELHKTKFKHIIADVDMPFHRLRRGGTFSRNTTGLYKRSHPIGNSISRKNSKFRFKIPHEGIIENQNKGMFLEAEKHSLIHLMIGGKHIVDQVLVGEIKKNLKQVEDILPRWSWSDEFFFVFFDFLEVTTVCATHLLRTFSGVHTMRVHFAHFSCVLHTNMDRCLHCAYRHLSLTSLSPFSCFTRLYFFVVLWRSLRDHSRLRPHRCSRPLFAEISRPQSAGQAHTARGQSVLIPKRHKSKKKKKELCSGRDLQRWIHLLPQRQERPLHQIRLLRQVRRCRGETRQQGEYCKIRRSVNFSSATKGCTPLRGCGKAARKPVASRRRRLRRLRQSWGWDLVLRMRTRCPKQ